MLLGEFIEFIESNMDSQGALEIYDISPDSDCNDCVSVVPYRYYLLSAESFFLKRSCTITFTTDNTNGRIIYAQDFLDFLYGLYDEGYSPDRPVYLYLEDPESGEQRFYFKEEFPTKITSPCLNVFELRGFYYPVSHYVKNYVKGGWDPPISSLQ